MMTKHPMPSQTGWQTPPQTPKVARPGLPIKLQLRVQAYFQWGPKTTKNDCGREDYERKNNENRTISLHT